MLFFPRVCDGAFNARSQAYKTEALFLSGLPVDDDDDRYHVHRKHAFKLSNAKGNEKAKKERKEERKEAERKRAREKVSRFSRRAMVYFCAPSHFKRGWFIDKVMAA